MTASWIGWLMYQNQMPKKKKKSTYPVHCEIAGILFQAA